MRTMKVVPAIQAAFPVFLKGDFWVMMMPKMGKRDVLYQIVANYKY